ncbi:energy transducer TonB [Permianibacter sp. IMCC34836]|uniref:energy transducer TonB n=1 Tax=Permianibacter fluminis TaxID=2738515 RepID=UPI00155326CC|nr:energy transducer TonB [Permianibacter fluminis]NQD35419.1 energy transducer TonB [Permianibacter fluminis]
MSVQMLRTETVGADLGHTGLTLLLAMTVSFALLALMARLVDPAVTPVVSHSAPIWAEPALLPASTEKQRRPRTLPKAPQQQAAQQSGPRIDRLPPDVDGKGDALPPFVPEGNPGWPGDKPVPGRVGPDLDQAMASEGLIPLSQIQPLYPRAQAAQGIEGQVTLQFLVQADGSVSDVRVVNATPRGAFEAAARQAVSKWRYRAHGSAAISQTVTLEFHLDD